MRLFPQLAGDTGQGLDSGCAHALHGRRGFRRQPGHETFLTLIKMLELVEMQRELLGVPQSRLEPGCRFFKVFLLDARVDEGDVRWPQVDVALVQNAANGLDGVLLC